MRLRFAGQPFEHQPNLVDFIDYATGNGFDELKVAVAWAKKSGLGRVWDAFEDFRERGGKVTLIVGVSEGGATKEGLELALASADEGYVFHDPRRTFHPKVYFASSSSERSLLVGSSNLTAGGLSWNYEASIWVDWAEGESTEVTDEVLIWFDTLIAENESCKPLTSELIRQMEESKDIVLGSEARTRRRQKNHSDVPEDNDSSLVTTINGLFKSVKSGLRKLPGVSSQISTPSSGQTEVSQGGGRNKASNSNHDSVPANGTSSPDLSAPPLPTSDVQRRWYKEMDNTAAQQVKSAKTNPTGNLRLSQGAAPINHKLYFRNDFFLGLPWAPTDGKVSEQEVMVGFRTWIDGDDLGVQELRVSHDPNRISGQGNVPTVLHWGSTVGASLRETNYMHFYVNLERTEIGNFNLIISSEPRGQYLV